MTVSVGDRVMLPEWGGNAIKVEDKEFHIFRSFLVLSCLCSVHFRNDDILAKLS